MIESFQLWVEGLPPVVQWLGVALISAVPFVESYFGSMVGVVAGINPVIAIAVAVLGNAVSMVAFVSVAAAARARVRAGASDEASSPRRQRLRRAFDRWGVPGVSLLGQTILPSQITSAAMVGFGASRRLVIVWQLVSILLWGIAFGLLAVVGIDLLSR